MAEETLALPSPLVARHDATERDVSRHTLTIKQAAELFSSLGVPRSPRSVQRFCELGNLDAIRVKGEKTERYFIDPVSVERYAKELRQLENISQLGADMSRHDATQRDVTRNDATAAAEPIVRAAAHEEHHETAELYEQLDTLKKENFQLQIDLSARVIVINQMTDERRHFLEQITTQSREIGQLETQLRLSAPPPAPARHDATVVVHEVTEEGRGEEPPAPPAEPMKPKPSLLRRLFS